MVENFKFFFPLFPFQSLKCYKVKTPYFHKLSRIISHFTHNYSKYSYQQQNFKVLTYQGLLNYLQNFLFFFHKIQVGFSVWYFMLSINNNKKKKIDKEQFTFTAVKSYRRRTSAVAKTVGLGRWNPEPVRDTCFFELLYIIRI